MKKSWNKFGRSFVAFMVSACLLVTLFVPLTAADDPLPTINYVSLGDSMSNGLGLPGYVYSGLQEVAPDAYPAKFAAWLAGYEGTRTINQKVYTGSKATVNLAQLAVSMTRIEDIHFILEYEAEDIPESERYPGDTWTTTGMNNYYRYSCDTGIGNDHSACNVNGFCSNVADLYQDSVRDADVITMAAGNGNFGVFMMEMVMNAVGMSSYGYDCDFATLQHALTLNGVTEQTKAIVLEAYNHVKPYLITVMGETLGEKLADRFGYVMMSFIINYDATLDRIVELNPDVDVILVPLMNSMSGIKVVLEDGSTLDFGDVMGYLLNPMNAYIAALPTTHQAKGDWAEAEFFYAEIDDVQCFVDTYATAIQDPGSVLRSRFVSTGDNQGITDGLVWNLLKPMINPLVDDYGLELKTLNLDKVKAYEAFAAEWAQYVDDNTVTEEPTADGLTDSEILSAAFYLAVEDAVLEASKRENATMSIDTFTSLLGGMDGLADAFENVSDVLDPEELINMNAIKATIMTNMSLDNYLTAAGNPDFNDTITQLEGAKASLAPTMGEAEFVNYLLTTATGDLASNLQTAVEHYKDLLGGSDPTTFVELAKIVAVMKVAQTNSENFMGAVMAFATQNGLLSKYAARFVAASVTEPLAEALKGNSALKGLLFLYARSLLNHGIGSHPSADGHQSLFEDIKAAYKGKTAQEKTDENLQWLVGEAYKYAYAYAIENGYIDMAKGYIDQAIAAVTAANGTVANAAVSAELEPTKLLLLEELANTLETLEKTKALLDITVLDDAAFQQFLELKAQLNKHVQFLGKLENALGLLGQQTLEHINGAVDYYTEVISDIIGDAYDKMMAEAANFAADYAAFVDSVSAAVEQINPALGAVVRAYLTETPAEALAILYTAGQDAVNAFIAAASTASDSIKEIIGSLSTVMKNDAAELVKALDDARIQAVNDEIAIAKAKIAGLKQTLETAIANGELIETIQNYEVLLRAAQDDLVILQTRLVNTILTVIDEVVDPATSAMAGKVFEALEKAIEAAEIAGGTYGQWFAGRFEQMSGELLTLIISKTKEYGLLAGGIIDDMIRTFLKDAKNDALDKFDEILGNIAAAGFDLSEVTAVIDQLNIVAGDIRAQIAALKSYTDDEIDAEIEKLEAALARVEAYTEKLQALITDIEDLISTIDGETDLTIEKAKNIVAQAKLLAEDAKALAADAKAALTLLASLYEEVMPNIAALADYIEEGSPADKFADATGMEIDEFINTVLSGYQNTRAAIETAAANVEGIVTEAVKAVFASATTAVTAITGATEIAVADITTAVTTAYTTIKTEANTLAQSANTNISTAGNSILEIIDTIELNFSKDDLLAKQAAIKTIVDSLISALENAEDIDTLQEAQAILDQAIIALEALGEIAKDIYTVVEGDVMTILAESGEQSADIQAVVSAAYGSISADASAAYTASAAAIRAAYETTVTTVKTALSAYETAVRTAAGEIITTVTEAAEQIGTEVTAVMNTAVSAIEAGTERATTGLTAIETAFRDALYDTTHGEYVSNGDSFYVALGNADYADDLAAALQLDAEQYAKYALSEIANVAGADLVTVDFDSNAFLTFAYERIMGLVAEVLNDSVIGQMVNNPTYGSAVRDVLANYNVDLSAEATELDWSTFDAEVVDAKNGMLTLIEIILREQGIPEQHVIDLGPQVMEILNEGLDQPIVTDLKIEITVPVIRLLLDAAETALYGYFDFSAQFPVILNEIRAAAPEAQVVVTGMEDFALDVLPEFITDNVDVSQYEKYLEYVIDALNLHFFAYASINTNTTYVEIGTAENIFDALNVTFEQSGLIGDADSDGQITEFDAMVILRYCAQLIPANEIDLYCADVDNDGAVTEYDAMDILRYCAQLITEFPAR